MIFAVIRCSNEQEKAIENTKRINNVNDKIEDVNKMSEKNNFERPKLNRTYECSDSADKNCDSIE